MELIKKLTELGYEESISDEYYPYKSFVKKQKQCPFNIIIRIMPGEDKIKDSFIDNVVQSFSRHEINCEYIKIENYKEIYEIEKLLDLLNKDLEKLGRYR